MAYKLEWSKREDTWISIDMGKVQPISMLKYTPRRSIANGIITKYSIYIKENENDQWTKVETENNVWERSIARINMHTLILLMLDM